MPEYRCSCGGGGYVMMGRRRVRCYACNGGVFWFSAMRWRWERFGLAKRRALAGMLGLAALLLALPAAADPFDGGLPPTVWAFEARLLVPELDGGTVWVPSTCYPVEDGGTECAGGWQPEPRLEAFGRGDTALRVENAVLRKTPPLFSTPTWVALAVCAAVFLLGGLVLGFEVDRLLPGH